MNVITPNSFKAQQEGREYQPQPNVDRMQGSDSGQQGQQWAGAQQEDAASQYQEQPGYQYQEQPEQQNQTGAYMQEYAQPPMQQNAPQGKSKVAAALLAFFLTWVGAANFYLGYKKMAFMQLGGFLIAAVLMIIAAIIGAVGDSSISAVAEFFTTIIPRCVFTALEIWAIVDFIRVLTNTSPMDRDVNGIPLT